MNKEEIKEVSNKVELYKGCGKVFLDFVCGEFDGLHLCSECKSKIQAENKRLDDLIKEVEGFIEFLEEIDTIQEEIGFKNFELLTNKKKMLNEYLSKLKQARELER